MPVSIVVGGQYGSEGKGKVAHYLAREMNAAYAVRCGGSNSGHTVVDEHGNARIFQHLPTASILPDVKLVICAGSYIDLDILFKEIEATNVDKGRLFIDPDAVIITPELKQRELKGGLVEKIGSTGSGTGAAVAARINREPVLFAKDVYELRPFIASVPEMLRKALDKNERIIIEGTQGFGLSPLHSRLFPYVTSRDTTAAAFLSETGLSPMDVDDIVLTIRAFPIRVEGNSGPLPNEIDWETITKEGGHTEKIQELTSVTKRLRRVARFDAEIVRRAIVVNRPTRIVLNHLDYISETTIPFLVKGMKNFILSIEAIIGRDISFLGLGRNIIIENKLHIDVAEVVNG